MSKEVPRWPARMQCASGSPPTLGPVGALRSSERTAAIRSTAGAPVVRLRACGRPARRTMYRSCGGSARPGPRRGTSASSPCRSMRHSTSLRPRASSGSTPDAQSVTKRAKSNLESVPKLNGRGTAEQWIRKGKNAIRWTRLSYRSMQANAVRLQVHALAYNLASFFRTLVLPDEVERWSLTTLRERVVKIGAKVIAHARYTVFQIAQVAVPRDLFRRILEMIDGLRPRG